MGVAFFTIAVGVAIWIRPWKWSQAFGARQTTGRVVGFVVRDEQGGKQVLPDGVDRRPTLGKHNATSVHPRVRYEVGGVTYECEGMGNTGYKIGDTLTVMYPPDHPGEGSLSGFLEQYLFYFMFGGGGFIFMLIGLGLLRKPRQDADFPATQSGLRFSDRPQEDLS
jgi:hypothetical protein